MIVHLRLTAPADLTDSVRETLCAKEWITNVTLQRDAVLDPPGDLLECDVAREKAGALIDKLERCGLKERGSILAVALGAVAVLTDSAVLAEATTAKSGPTTIAPTTSTAESVSTATAPSATASTRNRW